MKFKHFVAVPPVSKLPFKTVVLPKAEKEEKRRTRCHFAQTRLIFLAKVLNLCISFDNQQAGGYTYFI